MLLIEKGDFFTAQVYTSARAHRPTERLATKLAQLAAAVGIRDRSGQGFDMLWSGFLLRFPFSISSD